MCDPDDRSGKKVVFSFDAEPIATALSGLRRVGLFDAWLQRLVSIGMILGMALVVVRFYMVDVPASKLEQRNKTMTFDGRSLPTLKTTRCELSAQTISARG